MTSWRDRARPIIAKVIQDVGHADPKALRDAIRAAYPFGPRQYHPYKIWCDEVRSQLGLKPERKRVGKTAVVVKPAAGQEELF